MWWPCLVLSLALAVLNEVLYDPQGPDEGREFVELFNPGPAAVSLATAELRFVNGADPAGAALVWTGEPGLELAPGAFFVLGGEGVEGRDRTVRLGLQNGDEALELHIDGARVDAVAWGSTDLGLGEGPPAGPVAGQALGRVPDGEDTGHNARDFQALPMPTPGAVNLEAGAFGLAHWWPTPVWREDAGALDLDLELVATGWAAQQSGTVLIGTAQRPVSAAAGDTVRVSARIDCAPGRVALPLTLVVDGEGPRPLATLPLHCGTAEVVFTEVQPRPGDAEPEWVELLNRGALPVALAGWSLRDRGGRARGLVETATLAPGERVVFAADSVLLRSRYPAMLGRVLVPLGGWPSLNDSGTDGWSAADSLHLLDGTGAVVDLVTWRGDDLAERGRSLQRGTIRAGQASLWLPATGGATPGAAAPDESRSWPPDGLVCAPDPFTPDGDGNGDQLEVLFVGSFDAARAQVFDLRGDLVCELVLRGQGERHAARWDGRDAGGQPVPAGAYVIVVEAEGPGPGAPRQRRVVGLGRSR